MNVAVTGASGAVGGAAVRALLAAGHTVTALARRAAPPVARVRTVTGDVRDPVAMRELARGADAVVHAAAWVHRPAATPAARDECFAVNAGGTRNLIAGMRHEAARHLVFVSTIAVYGAPVLGAREDAPLRPGTAYGASKLEAERAVLEASAAGAISACVLRPCVVYGPGAPGNTERLLSLVRKGLVPEVGGGANPKSLVHLDDLAAAIVRCAESAGTVNGRVYNVAGPALTMRDIAAALAEGAGVPLRTLPVPAWLWNASAAALTALARGSGGRLPDLGRAFEVFTEVSTVDASAIARDLAVTFRDPRRGLADAVRAAAL